MLFVPRRRKNITDIRVDALEAADTVLDGRLDTEEAATIDHDARIDALEAVAYQHIALWVTPETEGMVTGDTILGYTAAQIADDFDGTPAVTLTGLGESGSNFAVLYDGTIVTGDSNNGTFFNVIPKERQTSQAIDPDLLRQIAVLSTSSNLVTQFSNGDVFLNDGLNGRRLTLQQLYSGRAGLSITGLNTPLTASNYAVDSHLDASGLWLSYYNEGGIVRLTNASLAAAGAAASDKIAVGSNFAGATGLAFDASGGLWHINGDTGDLVYHDAAAIAALNNTPSNPAATRTLTGLTGLWSTIVIDKAGGAWVGNYTDAEVYYLTAAQLAAGGAQTPTRTIETPLENIAGLRMSSGAGLFLR